MLLLGFGGSLLLVFPKTVISQTTSTPQEVLTYLEPDPVASEQLYQDWLKHQQLKKTKQIGDFNICSCVSYAKWKSGINVGSIGAAKNHPINSATPTVGGLVITNESSAGHMAVITQVWGNTIVITEANYIPCQISQREVRRDSPIIVGYYY